MKIIFLNILLSLFYCCAYGQVYYAGINSDITLVSTSKFGTNNSCYDEEIMFSYPCCDAPTGMNLYIRIDSISGGCDSVKVYRNLDYYYSVLHVLDTINVSINNNNIYFYMFCNSTLYISLVAIGTPQILGEIYNCNYTKENVYIWDNGCVSYYTLLGPVDSCAVLDFNTEFPENKLVNNIIIHPNPVKDELIVKVSQKSNIEIINVQGQILKKTNDVFNEASIDIQDLSLGLYIVKVQSKSGTSLTKLIKQ